MRGALVFSLWVVTAAAAPAWAQGSPASSVQVGVSPTRFVLGLHGEAQLRVTGLAPDAELRFSASSGTLSLVDAERAKDGHRLRWVPPDIRYPTWAVVLVWDARDPEGHVAVAHLALWGRTELEVATEPRAEVRIEVGGQSFGPVTADARGRAHVPIEVPPGAKTAQVFATAQGRQTTRTAPLEVPRTKPLAVALGPDPMPATGGWLFASVAGEDGARMGARAAEAGLQRTHLEGGDARYAVLPQPGAQSVSATVTVPGGEPRRAQVPVGERPAGPAASRRSPADGRDREGPTVHREGGWPVHALVGGYYAGGANDGLALEAGLGHVLPLWNGRLAAELSVGLRTGEFSGVARLGRVGSSVLAVPVTLSARALLFSRGPISLHARAGGGPMPFQQDVRAAFQPDVTTRGIGFELFAAGQVAYRAGPVDVIAEVRGAISQANGARIEATPGGFNAGLGVRWGGAR